jgi:hypothetical protein
MASFQAAISSISASSSRVCSRSGRPTFSFTVSEPNKPPCWNITPQRWRSARASIVTDVQQVDAEHPDGARVRALQQDHFAQQRRFAGAAATDQAKTSARRTCRSIPACTT